MREIKFRGLDINGRWFHGLLSKSQAKATQPKQGSYISNAAGSPFAYQVRPETVGQYTGLKDKNGKELFFDDIIDTWFGKRYYGRSIVSDLDSLLTLMLLHSESGAIFEIMGNIHENHEILK